MVRKICLILFLYYAVGTCVSQGTGAGAVAGARRTAPAALRHARVVACAGASGAR